jgi:predicted enzyme related to lactoylglutathione lyase
MGSTAKIGLVLDCQDPDRLAAFWAGALGYQSLGSAGTYTLLMPPDGEPGPQLLLQQVPESKTTKLRMHLDFHTPDVAAEAARLRDLGARLVDETPITEHGNTWLRMEDPEGNEFCVCDGGDGGG